MIRVISGQRGRILRCAQKDTGGWRERMRDMMDLFRKYRSLILYAVFGALTTLVNMASYWLCFNVLGIPNVPSTAIAWVLAVCFAFITNKLWVFDSPSFDMKIMAHEVPSFFGARLATGLLDVLVMYLAVDVMKWNSTLWKLISNVIVIVLNYIASKLVIFRKKDEQDAGGAGGHS